MPYINKQVFTNTSKNVLNEQYGVFMFGQLFVYVSSFFLILLILLGLKIPDPNYEDMKNFSFKKTFISSFLEAAWLGVIATVVFYLFNKVN